MPHRTWIKLHCEGWLRGSIRAEDYRVRAVFADILAMAGDSVYGDVGKIALATGVGWQDEALATVLNLPFDVWIHAKNRLSNHPDPKENRIVIVPLTIGYRIDVLNWNKYQSEYERQKQYRSPKLYTKLLARLQGEGEGEREREKNPTLPPPSKKKKSFAASAARRAWFDNVFWSSYPNRGGRKRNKMDAWEIVARLQDADLPALEEAVRNYAASEDVERGYAKDPHRWLQKDRWRDWNGAAAKQAATFEDRIVRTDFCYRCGVKFVVMMENPNKRNCDACEDVESKRIGLGPES